MDSIDLALSAARKSRRLAMDKTVSTSSGGGHYFDAKDGRVLPREVGDESYHTKAGRKAKEVGKSEGDNPYPKGSEPHRQWQEGFFGTYREPYPANDKTVGRAGAKDAEYVEVPHRGRVPPREARDESVAWTDGYRDQTRGKSNPHPQGSQEYRDWQAGFEQSRKENFELPASSGKISVPNYQGKGRKTKWTKPNPYTGAYDSFALDESTVRSFDVDGRLHVSTTNISKATVNPYKGIEIPDYETLGLDKDKTYQLLRHPDELAKAAPTFNNLPLLSKHVPLTADTHKPEIVIGSTGTDASFEFPYLKNSLVLWSKDGITDVESASKKELSSAYRYKADMTPGTWEGIPYDGVMREIEGNHVALVKEGRAGHDVVVGDSKMTGVVAGRKRRPVMGRMSKTAATGIALMGTYLRPKLAQDAKIDLAPVFKGLNLKNLDERRPEIIREVRALTKGKLATDASIGEIAEVLDLLEAHPDTGEDAPVTDTQEALMSELTTVPGTPHGSGEPGGDRRMRAKDRRNARDRFPRDAAPPPPPEDLPPADPNNEEVEGLDNDPTSAVEAFLKDKISGADLQHVCNMMRGEEASDDNMGGGGDTESHPGGEEKLEDLGAAHDLDGGQSDVERSQNWAVGTGSEDPEAGGQSGRALDRRSAKDRRAKDKRAFDQPPPFKGMPKPGGEIVDKKAMDAAIKAVVAEERKSQMAIRQAEREVRPWVGDLAMDAAMSSEDVYRIALTTLGIKDLDKIHPSAYQTILSYQSKPGTARHTTLSGQRVAMDAATQQSFHERHPDVARIRVI